MNRAMSTYTIVISSPSLWTRANNITLLQTGGLFTLKIRGSFTLRDMLYSKSYLTFSYFDSSFRL